MTELEQRLTGENQVLRDLLKDVLSVLKIDVDLVSDDELGAMLELIGQIESALKPTPTFDGLES